MQRPGTDRQKASDAETGLTSFLFLISFWRLEFSRKSKAKVRNLMQKWRLANYCFMRVLTRMTSLVLIPVSRG